MKYSSANFPSLHTARLTLRRITSDDIPSIFALRSDPDVNRYIKRTPARDISEALIFYESITTNMENGLSANWAIACKSSNEMLGSICLWNYSQDLSKAEVGYDLLPAHQGKGYMSEALRAVLAFGFQTMKFQKIEAFTSKHNAPSIALLTKQNFTLLPDRTDEGDDDNLIFCLSSQTHNSSEIN